MKAIRRSVSEVSQLEKVQIHFKFNDLKSGYAEIGREHHLDNCDIYTIVTEIEKLRSHRAENPKVKHVMRRVYVNKHRTETKPPKKSRSPRPDNRRKVVSRELDLAEDALITKPVSSDEPKHSYRQPQNSAMADALKSAFARN